MINIRKLESELWESADLLRAESKLTSNQYCMPVLGLIFLRYAYSRFKMVEAEILQNRPMRNGRVMPVEASDFASKSALFLPKEAQFDYLVNLPADVKSANITNKDGHVINSLGEAVNNAMELVEQQSTQLKGILPKDYTIFSDELLGELLRIFNNSALDDVGGDIIGRIYEYFLSKFAPAVASDDGVFFTPKSLVKMIVNVLEPKSGTLLDPACGSGGMFVQTGDFVNASGMEANSSMTFYGQEKVEYNAQLCLMNMAVHGLTGVIKSGNEANTFYHDAHNLDGCCDYVMANPPFNVDKVKSETCDAAGRLPFGLPSVNKNKEVGNANYLWISYFYSYLNEHGRAGFVMASSATDSQGKDKDIREALIKTGHVDVMISVGNNFFYTKSLPCSLWFLDKGKSDAIKDKVLFIDARNYYTVVDRTLNEWSEWQLKNLNAIVWLYRGETGKYKVLLDFYKEYIFDFLTSVKDFFLSISDHNDPVYSGFEKAIVDFADSVNNLKTLSDSFTITGMLDSVYSEWKKAVNDIFDYPDIFKRINAKLALKKCGYKNANAFKKQQINQIEAGQAKVYNNLDAIKEAQWLYEKFGEGEYKDIPGLCKIACITDDSKTDEKDISVEEKGWSLTPGAYVGVAPVDDDGVDFAERMKEIRSELLSLQAESNELMNTISKNMEEMGI